MRQYQGDFLRCTTKESHMESRADHLKSLNPATQLVHGGEKIDISPAIPTVSPIHFSTSFVFESADDLDHAFDHPAESYAYARFGNPTVRALETAMAVVENCEAAIAYPSGMAAINGVFQQFAKPGDHVLASRDVYGATLTLLENQFKPNGVIPHYVDPTDLDAVRALAEEVKPTLIYSETISNPLIKVSDIRGLAEIARSVGAALVIDNTFASPVISRPTDLGATLTLHSTTKYLAGHGDVMGGAVSGPKDIIEPMRTTARINGAVPGPMDAWLTVRGMKTLAIRMREHSRNARIVAEWLSNDSRIETVNYPSVDDGLAAQFLSDDRGGMLSFEVKGFGTNEVFRFLESVRIIEPATTLGDVSSLALYPAKSSQRGLTAEQRAEWGIGDNLIRLSVGIEDANDIIADLDQALEKASVGLAVAGGTR
jgi:cystathionine beta-lyase/cystathionine gamma-synthase